MKIIKLACGIFACVLFSCKEKQPQQNQNDETKKSDNTKVLDSLKLRDHFNSAKWLIYQQKSQDTLIWNFQPKGNQTKIYTFGELNINLDTLEIRNDTVDFKICYSIGEKYKCDDPFIGNECYILNVGVSISTNLLLYYKTACNFEVTIDRLFERQNQKKKANLKQYIENNFGKLNSWFREEVLRRKIITTSSSN